MGQKVDIFIFRGNTFRKTYIWKDKRTNDPIILDGWEALFEVFLPRDVAVPVVSLSSVNQQGITLDVQNGKITIEINKDETKFLAAGTGIYKLHMLYPDDNFSYRLAWGSVNISE